MLAEEAGRHAVGHRPFDRLADDVGLVFAEGQQDDLPGLEDRGDAHRQGLGGHVVLVEKVAGRVLPRHRIERHQPGAAVADGEGLVEGDVPVAADAQQKHVDPARPADFFLVLPAMLLDGLRRRCAVEDVDVLAGDVHVVEEGLEHPAVVALQPVGPQPVVFVQVEGNDAGEVEFLLAVQADQFAVDAHGGRAGGQAENGVVTERVPFADCVGDNPGNVARYVLVLLEPITRDLRGGNQMGGVVHVSRGSRLYSLHSLLQTILSAAGRQRGRTFSPGARARDKPPSLPLSAG